jgi:outer membrane lipoprotein-sorting protein
MRRAFPILATLVAGISLVSAVAEAQTLDELIARNLQAKGGLETLKTTNTVKMTGRFKTQGVDMLVTTWAKRPNLVRREAEFTPPPQASTPVGQAPLPQKNISASDGKTVWVMMGSAPPQEVPGAQAEGVKNDAEFDSIFVNYREKGHKIELVGKETQNGKPVYHLKVTRRDGPVQQYFLDAETGLESRIVTDVNQNGMKLTVETELTDYRQIEGRMVPFRTKQSANGTTAAEMNLETIQFNVPIDDGMFRMPK